MNRERSSTSTRTKNNKGCSYYRRPRPYRDPGNALVAISLFPPPIAPFPTGDAADIAPVHSFGYKGLHTLSARNLSTCYPERTSKIRNVCGSTHHCLIVLCLHQTLKTGTHCSTARMLGLSPISACPSLNCCPRNRANES